MNQPDLFAPEERQPDPLPPVQVKPGSSAWTYEDRVAHITKHCPSQLNMVGPQMEALGRARLRQIDERENDRRAGNDTRRY